MRPSFFLSPYQVVLPISTRWNNMNFFSAKSISRQNTVYLLLIFVAIVCISLLASVPPVSRDALTHHLVLPKLWLEQGGLFDIPYLVYSYYPPNLNLLYMVPMYFGNDIIPKYIHFAFALITAAMIYGYLYRRINTTYALLGALFFLSIPVIVRLSSTVYVDLGLICFTFASLLYLFRWIEFNFKLRYIIISAVFCGLALGTKYNGLVGLFLIALFIPFIYERYNPMQKWHGVKSIAWCTAFVLVVLIVCSPWMIRNTAWTGNPIHPLYKSVFNPKSSQPEEIQPDSVIEKRASMSHIDFRREVLGESVVEIALIPLRVFFQGKDDTPKYFDGKLNPFLLILSVFAFFGVSSGTRQEKTEKLVFLFFSVLFLLYACAQTSIRIRYFSPIIPPLVVLSMFGLYNIRTVILEGSAHLSEPLKNCIILGIVFVMLGFNANYIANRFKLDQPIDYITGKVTRDEYIQMYRPEYASFQYANKTLTDDAKIFGLYLGNRRYYSDIDISFSIKKLQHLAADANSGAYIAEKLAQKGFTHLLVSFSLFNYWVQKYSLHERQMLIEFFDNYTVLEFSKDSFGLLSIKQ